MLARVGSVAYRLKLPDNSKLHPVFHVSCLKKHLRVAIQPTIQLHVLTDDGILQDVLVAILDRRMVKKGTTAITEMLVHWQNHTSEEATWETYSDLKLRFLGVAQL
ncbi:hypothetical protein ACFX1R_043093 [Malus domestica]